MTTVFHTWAYGRFIEIQSNLRRKKLHRANFAGSVPGSIRLPGSIHDARMLRETKLYQDAEANIILSEPTDVIENKKVRPFFDQWWSIPINAMAT